MPVACAASIVPGEIDQRGTPDFAVESRGIQREREDGGRDRIDRNAYAGQREEDQQYQRDQRRRAQHAHIRRLSLASEPGPVPSARAPTPRPSGTPMHDAEQRQRHGHARALQEAEIGVQESPLSSAARAAA